MASSDLLDIFNSALLNIGASGALSSVTEQSAEAAACALRYPSIARTILRDVDWNCVRRRVGLIEVAAGAVWAPSWQYMYRYPADCLVVRGFDTGTPHAKVILTNVACPVMIYTSYVLDMANGSYEAKFDGQLRETLGWALAAAIAGPLTGSKGVADAAKAETKNMLAAAKQSNTLEGNLNIHDEWMAESLTVRAGYWPYGEEPFYWNRTR
jgi:hypothetical protein